MVNVKIYKSKGKWARKMAKIIPKEQTIIYTKMLVEALTNQKVERIEYEN